MAELITNGEFSSEERPGWNLKCPRCEQVLAYTVLNLTAGSDVFLYCDTCSNFVLREEDRQELMRVLNGSQPEDFDTRIGDLYKRLEASLPSCQCGGHFTLWSNVKCSSCHYEFPYNDGIRNFAVRYRESKLVWMESAVAYRGALMPSNILSKVK